jgi:2-methylaconitate cis-trans-isomerase PrpF
MLDWGDVGGTLGRGLLPTGIAREVLDTSIGPVELSIVDAGNVTAFVRPRVFGITSAALARHVMDKEMLQRIEAVRGAVASRLEMVDRPERANEVTPTIPKLYLIDEAVDYTDVSGRHISAERIDMIGRGMSMGTPHAAYAGTVAVCTGAAALIPGTLVHESVKPHCRAGGRIRIGHPMGVIDIDAELKFSDGRPQLQRAAVLRTARCIMEGTVFVPASRLQ